MWSWKSSEIKQKKMKTWIWFTCRIGGSCYRWSLTCYRHIFKCRSEEIEDTVRIIFHLNTRRIQCHIEYLTCIVRKTVEWWTVVHIWNDLTKTFLTSSTDQDRWIARDSERSIGYLAECLLITRRGIETNDDKQEKIAADTFHSQPAEDEKWIKK